MFILKLLDHNDDMVKFICKIGPHIIIAVHKEGLFEKLLLLSQVLHPTFINILQPTPSAHIFDVLWKSSISSHKDKSSELMEEVRIETKLQVLALQYLIMTEQQLDMFGPKSSAAVRNMTNFERQYHTSVVWETMLVVLERMAEKDSGLVRMAELIFSLPRLNYEATGELANLSGLCEVLPKYSVYLSALRLEPLFELIISFVNDLQNNNNDMQNNNNNDLQNNNNDLQNNSNFVILCKGVKDLLMNGDKDITWICLYSSKLLSTLIVQYNTITLNFLALIYQVSKLLLRSPQSGSLESVNLLLSHTHTNVLPLYDTEPQVVFEEHSGLLQLHILALTKDCNNHIGYTEEDLLDTLLVISEKMPASLQLSCLLLGESIPYQSTKFCLYHSLVLKREGFLTDACNILVKMLSLPNVKGSDVVRCQLQLAICLIMKLDVEEALQTLNKCDIEGLQTGSSTSIESAVCLILKTYCSWVLSIKKDDQYQLPPATQFCKAVHTLLAEPCDPSLADLQQSRDSTLAVIGDELSCDPCVISLTMMLCGLYGLPGLLAQCSEHLEPCKNTVNTMLCAIPCLVLAGQGLDECWKIYDDISLFVEVMSKELLEDYTSNNALPSAIAKYLLIDFKLSAGEQVYDCSSDSVMQCLEAAHAKLKNFKKLPTKLLLWKSCCVLPLLLQIMERYIRLLNIWGSMHTALSYLSTFEQIASFLQSNYWTKVHNNLLTLVYISLGEESKAKKALTKSNDIPKCLEEGNTDEMECHDVEQDLDLEFKVLVKEIQRRSDADPSDGEVELPKSLPLRSMLKLQLLKAQCCYSNGIFPDDLKALDENSGYINQETFKLLNALHSLQYVRHLPPEVAPQAKRRGRTKQRSQTSDRIETGLASCEGLYPVIVMRVLLSEKLKINTTWSIVQQYHALPLQHQLHQLHNVLPAVSAETLPNSWSVVSITKIEDVIYIGRQCGKDGVLFKRDLPYTIKSSGMSQARSHASCTDEMEYIIRGNDSSIAITDKVEFWKSRFLLDKNLAALLVHLQNEWLGPWKGLMLGTSTVPEYLEDLKKRATSLRKELKSKYKINITYFLSEYILDSYSILSDGDMADLLPSSTPQILSLIHDKAPSPTSARHPSLLCLGNGTAFLPWEACPVYNNQTICRVPSLSFVLKVKALRSLPVVLDKENTYYMLNPRNDLPNTQCVFQSWLEDHPWQGVIAKAPSIKDYKAALSADLFLYLGHGSGKEFLKGKSIQEFHSRAVALLMGCSSGRLKNSPVGTFGTPIEYLLSGCPAVVGYLWNVTDRDCDRFSKRLLELWLEQGTSSTLPSLVNPSRDVCKLKHLVGAAPVVYGVPDILTG